MKLVNKIFIILLLLIVVSQFFGPDKNDGDIASVNLFLTETNPPENVKKILETTCFDCHSNKTTYPWYNSITPLNFWLDHHIEEGKEHLNFSEWSSYSLKKKDHKIDELYEEVEEGEMPLNSYTWLHKEANLSQDQIEAIVTWGKKVRAGYKQQMSAK